MQSGQPSSDPALHRSLGLPEDAGDLAVCVATEEREDDGLAFGARDFGQCSVELVMLDAGQGGRVDAPESTATPAPYRS